MWTPLVVALGGRLAFGDELPNGFGGATLGMLAGAGKELATVSVCYVWLVSITRFLLSLHVFGSCAQCAFPFLVGHLVAHGCKVRRGGVRRG